MLHALNRITVSNYYCQDPLATNSLSNEEFITIGEVERLQSVVRLLHFPLLPYFNKMSLENNMP